MKKYDVSQLIGVISYLRATEELAGKDGDGTVPWDWKDKHHRPNVEAAKKNCQLLELSASVRRCNFFFKELNRKSLTWFRLKTEARVLLQTIEGELHERLFAFVPMEKAAIIERLSTEWSPIWNNFPSSEEESERAADCYALEQSTACVMHLMRVLEVGLGALATEMNIAFERRNWENIINDIEAAIEKINGPAWGPDWKEKSDFYSGAAKDFRYFKKAWRNHAMHYRKQYPDPEASTILAHVKTFMMQLAEGGLRE